MNREQYLQKLKDTKSQLNSENGYFSRVIKLSEKVDQINFLLDQYIDECKNYNIVPVEEDELSFLDEHDEVCLELLVNHLNNYYNQLENLRDKTSPSIIIGED